MSLPRLPDLDDVFENDKKQDKVKSSDKSSKKEKEITKEKRKTKIPKSEYDSNGKPSLAIPDLDDVNLMNEIEKYFGVEED